MATKQSYEFKTYRQIAKSPNRQIATRSHDPVLKDMFGDVARSSFHASHNNVERDNVQNESPNRHEIRDLNGNKGYHIVHN
ncbi:uncharacterized protein PADG_11895 [Paracoccidioides brasiliensis Pb18]|uniref:Uncharacterized protein n=1 Tax=Paracoccidioides brasiliensis (strain Pb18) TaxID=502780 RepID=A0A0A0HTD5_PARBD|nr:uncharacterized protein PADG_11895 [Paracoccidioides brasiliensis Pb18]KGM91922.1 hypothetical protein PADG_11895 [Paracoccidioides brasiliensis Pb18]